MNYIFKILLLTLVICSCANLHKQVELGDYDLVITKYAETLEKNNPEINYQVAEAYRRSNRIQESEPFYSAAVTAGVTEQDVYYFYARALKANKKYEEAKKVLESHITKISDEMVRNLVEHELYSLNHLNDNMKGEETYFRIKNLESLNTPATEYSPVINNNYLYFTSNREGGRIYKSTGTPFTDIYKVRTKGANVSIRTLKSLDPIINEAIVNEGSIALSSDGNSVIYAKGNSGKATGNNDVNLYFSRFRNSKWSNPRPISVNDPNSWDSTPALSVDGKKLYFSSTRPGGYGGADIYSAQLNRRGRWVDVRNLGPEINTQGNEMFPFISEGGSLYFASDTHPGFGGLDVFVAERYQGITIVENLGEPMNSHSDDFGFYEYNLAKGFFSSNRPGGKGDDDIYTFVNDDPDLKIINYFLTGTTFTKDDGGKEIVVSNTKVSLVSKDGTILDESFAGEDGVFSFRVYAEEEYDIIGEKTEYFTTRKRFTTIGKSVRRDTLTEFITNVEFETDINLDRIVIEKSIVLNNIYYDLAKWDIRPDAEPMLDSLVMIMNDNPEIYIELGSHTDSRADDDYNMDLSFKRARSAVNYIIEKGVNKERVVAKGYGELELIVKNAQTENQHQINRRTEFKVLRYNPRERQDNLPPDEELDEYERFFDDNGKDN